MQRAIRGLDILPVFMLLLTSCASRPAIDSASQDSGPIGTWRWRSADGTQVTSPDYVRFYADGTCAWWPAIEAKFSTNGVTYSRYRVEGALLNLDPDPNSFSFHRYKLMKIKGDKMTLIGEESDREVYQRVVPNLEPGT
jgi:hypothetical protein